MRFEGRVFRAGRHWAIEVPLLGVFTQGRTREDAYDMIVDAVSSLATEDLRIRVYRGRRADCESGAEDDAAWTAFFLRRARLTAGLTLGEVARRLGSRSVNAYARYEQGRAVPTVAKLWELLAAVAPERDYVLVESRAGPGRDT